jgi:hypothetical protein
MKISQILIGTLLLTNTIAVGMWWRSQQQMQYWQAEARDLMHEKNTAAKEVNSLQEAIARERGSSVNRLKLHVLTETALGKCIVDHPKKTTEICGTPEWLNKSYQKVSHTDSNTFLESLPLLIATNEFNMVSNIKISPETLKRAIANP